MSDLDLQILDAVAEIPGISVMLLFGSRARGNHRPDSDLDVAVIPRIDDPRTRRRLRLAVAVALAHLAPEGRVDVVLLDDAPVLLRQRVMEHGRLLLGHDQAVWRRLRVQTMREYHDQEWARRLLMTAQRRRLLEGRFGGRSARIVDSLKRSGRLPH